VIQARCARTDNRQNSRGAGARYATALHYLQEIAARNPQDDVRIELARALPRPSSAEAWRISLRLRGARLIPTEKEVCNYLLGTTKGNKMEGRTPRGGTGVADGVRNCRKHFSTILSRPGI